MSVSDFEQRRNKILEIVVEAHVATMAPVGSELIAKRLHDSLSPATIRNIMGELEEQGFLEQPHTSAGRVPTERGYRFYVDSVMGLRRLPLEEVQQLESLVQSGDLEIEEFFDRTCIVLAELARQTAFIVAPTVKQSRVRQIELVPVGVRRVLCVLIADDEMIASHVVEIEEPISREEAVALGRFINTELVGLPFSDLVSSLKRRLLAENDSFYHLVKRSLIILQHALSTEPEERLFLEGLSYLMSQPEFNRNTQKAQQVFKHLEEHQQDLLQCLRRSHARRGLEVRIGHEMSVSYLNECSYINAPFSIGETIIGCVGIIGPKRMDYSRVGAIVDGMARCMSNILEQWDRE